MDVIKTRQQLQGEMVAVRRGVKDLELKKELKKQPYKSIYQSIRSIVQAEGILGLQKGLASALAFQFCMNSVRLGTYQTIDNLGWNRRSNGELHPGLCIFWGNSRIRCLESGITWLESSSEIVSAWMHSKTTIPKVEWAACLARLLGVLCTWSRRSCKRNLTERMQLAFSTGIVARPMHFGEFWEKMEFEVCEKFIQMSEFKI